MPPLESLLEVQEIDLAVDALNERLATLPARAAQRAALAARSAIDAKIAEAEARRSALEQRERELGVEVGAAAARAAELESQLYSGEVSAAKELQTLQHELQQQRATQGSLEDGELALLEQMDEVEGEIAAHRGEQDALAREAEALGKDIEKIESEIGAEVADLAARRGAPAARVPEAIMVRYGERRARPRLRGRGAAQLGEGTCLGCRIKLPVMEYSRIKHAPDDAMECCPGCGRVLVRS